MAFGLLSGTLPTQNRSITFCPSLPDNICAQVGRAGKQGNYTEKHEPQGRDDGEQPRRSLGLTLNSIDDPAWILTTNETSAQYSEDIGGVYIFPTHKQASCKRETLHWIEQG
jgi:hypothetical protein